MNEAKQLTTRQPVGTAFGLCFYRELADSRGGVVGAATRGGKLVVPGGTRSV
jgi:hypothetical protein